MIRDRSLPSQLEADKEIKVLCAHEFAHAKMSLGDIPRSREIYLSLSFASFALVDKNQNHFFFWSSAWDQACLDSVLCFSR